MFTVIVALITLGILIFVHELGHFLAAKAFGVRVEVFSLGFGTKLFGVTRGETEYRLSAVPLGGYVRMLGEDPEDEVPLSERAHSFGHQKVIRRLAIVLAGPMSNLALAVVLYFLVLMTYGIPALSTHVGGVLDGKPAQVAGIKAGDQVLSVNGRQVADWSEMVAAIQSGDGGPLRFSVLRDGKPLEVNIEPDRVEVTDIFGEPHQMFQVGIQAGDQVIIHDVGLGQAGQLSLVKTWYSVKLIFTSVVKILQAKISVDNLGGPIMIAQAAGEAASHGLAPLMDLAALISANLFVVNLLPIPALDGGHIFFFLIEAIRRKPLSLKARLRAQQVGMAAVLALIILISFNDVLRLVQQQVGQ